MCDYFVKLASYFVPEEKIFSGIHSVSISLFILKFEDAARQRSPGIITYGRGILGFLEQQKFQVITIAELGKF